MKQSIGFRSLRWRLMALIAAVLALSVGFSFVAIYRGTGSELRQQIDRELRGDSLGFARGIPPSAATPAAIETAARSYLSGQPFSRSTHLLFLRVGARAPVTNEPKLLHVDHEGGETGVTEAAELRQADALLGARRGYSEVRIADVGELRVFTTRIARGSLGATIGVGEPLDSVERAQHGVARTFVLAGSLTLLVALIAGYLIATRTTRPLTRLARIAQQVDGGDLSPRMARSGPHDEVRVLADSFDRMLDRLEDAFARQRAFAADASHELRTPLTVIRGQLEVLARQAAPAAEDVRHVEQIVRTETLRMQRLVEDLLVLARAEEREFLHPREIRLEAFLSELFDGVRTLAQRRFELGPLPRGTLIADPDRLAQALRNLVRNAIEHTARDGLVRIVAAADAAGTVTFAVEDDGAGIPPEQRERVFDRFHRTDSARTRAGGGAGLGLAIVHAIVTAHGGRLSVGDSAEGGARVGFDLPGFAASAAPPGEDAGASSPSTRGEVVPAVDGVVDRGPAPASAAERAPQPPAASSSP